MVISDFDCRVLEENVMLLNDFSLELDGREVYRGPVCGAWHKHFYPAADGTPSRPPILSRPNVSCDRVFRGN